jgi:asparagine synthase (glutamine-hydrolysing)
VCGIAGLMTCDGRRPDSAVLDRLEAAIAHRGPDGSGRYISGGTGLLNTRLAIIDLRTGMQPLYEEQGAALVANGEIYNDLELRAKMRDACFKTGSDCESALHLYRRKGLDFVEELRGMYAIAIHDPVTSRLVLARDPFGIKPLYYVQTPTYFAFASEPQALLAAGLADRAINPRARAELFQLKFTTGSDSIFSQIRRVLPGETLVVADGQIVERRQRDALPQDGPRRLSYSQALQQLDKVLTDSVVHHIRSDVPYGLFLSGGIDSSTLLGLMARISTEPVVALTACFPGTRAANERADAERIARFFGAAHHVVEMTERDFWSDAPRVAQALDDPTTDAATLPTFALAKVAKAQVKVVLSGEGGDEMFCGYSRYRRARWFRGMFTRNARTHGEFQGLGNMNGTLDGWRDGLNQTEREIAQDSRRTFVQRLQAVDCAQWLPNDLLIKLDRCLMRNAIEGRTPFLDPVVADFAFRLTDDQKATTRMSKRLLRDWLAVNAPTARPYARKTGFNPPVGEWIAVRKALLEPMVAKEPGIAEAFTIDDVHRVFIDPEKNPQAAWSLLFYALWHSHHVLGTSAEGTVEDVLDAARHLG